MRFDLLSLVALPGALAAAISALAYSPPVALRTMAAQAGCNFPNDFQIRQFTAKSNDTGATLQTFNFTFFEDNNAVTTFCEFNSSSVSTTPPGLEPRYPCENRDIKFIWEDDKKNLWMIQRLCPGADGVPDYQVSGVLNVPVVCNGTGGACSGNATEYTARYTSINPVTDPTMLKMMRAA
ncbi:hypothetical protein HJFPF1_01497 [Paramyrothecium foliicola]|nr:hypothetical protein HJFPF1_01497 [Paramyrothecium foliicola]